MDTTWDELAARAIARQFPVPAPDVATTLAQMGPIQSQTARSTHLGVAARRPGTTRTEIAEAFESARIVRGSTIRGTVHTATPEHFAALTHATALGQGALWRRSLGVDDDTVAALWAATEVFASEEWRTVDDLSAHAAEWLAQRGHRQAAAHVVTPAGRYLTFGHGGLVRRPVNGAWEGQAAALYRTATQVTGHPGGADLTDVVRLHLEHHGPASRHDLAWWAGVGLRAIDGALARLDLVEAVGPDGRIYADVPDAPDPAALQGVRLLPEFDALLCAYEPSARTRFITAAHHRRLWNSANGTVLSPLLVDGRITGYWRAMGSAARRALSVHWFAGTRAPRTSELDGPVAAVESALGITVTDLTCSRE